MIQTGQLYRSANPRDNNRIIKVTDVPHPWGEKVEVASLTESGREVRRRWMNRSSFHDSAITHTGRIRTAGYVRARREERELSIVEGE